MVDRKDIEVKEWLHRLNFWVLPVGQPGCRSAACDGEAGACTINQPGPQFTHVFNNESYRAKFHAEEGLDHFLLEQGNKHLRILKTQ